MVKIKIDRNSQKAMLKLKNIDKLTKAGIRNAFYLLGRDLVATAKQRILSKEKSGRIYRINRGQRTINHRASAPGESPASITGKLWRSLDFRVNGADNMTFG